MKYKAQDREAFTQQVDQMIHDALQSITPILAKGGIKLDINYETGRVFMLEDDANTIWVKLWHYDCKVEQLPLRVFAMVVDQLIKEHSQ